MTERFYIDSHAAILTYAVDDEESFIEIKKWKESLDDNAGENVMKILVANKTDLEDREISEYDGNEEADS